MQRKVACHSMTKLTTKECPKEMLLETSQNTELHIVVRGGQTIIMLPMGNKFNVVNGRIIIHESTS